MIVAAGTGSARPGPARRRWVGQGNGGEHKIIAARLGEARHGVAWRGAVWQGKELI